MDLEVAAQCQVTVHSHAHEVASMQFRCGCAVNIRLKCDVVHKIFGKLETIAKNLRPATQDAQLHDFISEAVSTGDPQVIEVSLGDLHLSGEPIVGRGSFNVQSGLSTCIHSNYWLETRLEPERSSASAASGACCAIANEETAETAAIDIAVRSFFVC